MGASIPPKYVVGFKYTNKQGLDMEVVEYHGRKDILVKFLVDGVTKKTTGSYIKEGLPMHPTIGKHYVGERFPCHDGDTVEIVELTGQTKARIKWLSDGAEKIRGLSEIREGFNRHPTKNVPVPGQKFMSRSSGEVTVVEFRNAVDVLVEYSDGVQDSVPVSRLTSGNIRHPYCNLTIGSKYTTKSGWKLKILEYKDAHNVLVEWQDGSKSWEVSSHIRLGSIKPLFQPSVEGIGYLGEGKYASGLKKDGEKADPRIYGFWIRMFSRCYNPFELNKPRNRKYQDVHIDKEWHNFQNFAEWACSQPLVLGEDVELDKDLLSGDAKVYSKETCTILPAEINRFLIEQDSGKYYRGVHVIMPKHPNARIGYIARCNTSNGKREYLGFYKTPEEAFYAYKKCKEDHAKILATKWRDKIDPRAYEALMNYTVEITD